MSAAQIILSQPLIQGNCDRISGTTGLDALGATFHLVEDADGTMAAITELRDGTVIANDDWWQP